MALAETRERFENLRSQNNEGQAHRHMVDYRHYAVALAHALGLAPVGDPATRVGPPPSPETLPSLVSLHQRAVAAEQEAALLHMLAASADTTTAAYSREAPRLNDLAVQARAHADRRVRDYLAAALVETHTVLSVATSRGDQDVIHEAWTDYRHHALALAHAFGLRPVPDLTFRIGPPPPPSAPSDLHAAHYRALQADWEGSLLHALADMANTDTFPYPDLAASLDGTAHHLRHHADTAVRDYLVAAMGDARARVDAAVSRGDHVASRRAWSDYRRHAVALAHALYLTPDPQSPLLTRIPDAGRDTENAPVDVRVIHQQAVGANAEAALLEVLADTVRTGRFPLPPDEAAALNDLAAQARDHADERTQEYLDLAGENPAQQRSGNDGPQIFTAFVPPATLGGTAPAPGTTDQTLEQARQRAAQAHADLVRFETELETQRTRNNWNETHPDYQNGLHRAAQLRQEAARADHDLNTLQARTTNTTPPTTTGHDLSAFPVFDIPDIQVIVASPEEMESPLPPALQALRDAASLVRVALAAPERNADQVLSDIDTLIEQARSSSQDLPPGWEPAAAMVRDYSRFALGHLPAAPDPATHRSHLENAVREVLTDQASADSGHAPLRDYLDHARQLAELLGYTNPEPAGGDADTPQRAERELLEGSVDLAPPAPRETTRAPESASPGNDRISLRDAYLTVAERARAWHALNAQLHAAQSVHTDTAPLEAGRGPAYQDLERVRAEISGLVRNIGRRTRTLATSNDGVIDLQRRADAALRDSQDFLTRADEQLRLREALEEELADLENDTTDDAPPAYPGRTAATPDYDTLIDEARAQATELRDQARNHATEADHTLASLARVHAELARIPETDTAARTPLLQQAQDLENTYTRLRDQARAHHARADYHQTREQALTRQRDTEPTDTGPDRDQQTTELRDRIRTATTQAQEYFARAEELRGQHETLTAQAQQIRSQNGETAAALAKALGVTTTDLSSTDAAAEVRDLHTAETTLNQNLTDGLRFWTERVFLLNAIPSQDDALHAWNVNLARANIVFLQGRLGLSDQLLNTYTELATHILAPLTTPDAVTAFLAADDDIPAPEDTPPAYTPDETAPTPEPTTAEQRGQLLARYRHTIDDLRQRIAALTPDTPQHTELTTRLDHYIRSHHHHARIQAEALGTPHTPRIHPNLPDLRALPTKQRLQAVGTLTDAARLRDSAAEHDLWADNADTTGFPHEAAWLRAEAEQLRAQADTLHTEGTQTLRTHLTQALTETRQHLDTENAAWREADAAYQTALASRSDRSVLNQHQETVHRHREASRQAQADYRSLALALAHTLDLTFDVDPANRLGPAPDPALQLLSRSHREIRRAEWEATLLEALVDNARTGALSLPPDEAAALNDLAARSRSQTNGRVRDYLAAALAETRALADALYSQNNPRQADRHRAAYRRYAVALAHSLGLVPTGDPAVRIGPSPAPGASPHLVNSYRRAVSAEREAALLHMLAVNADTTTSAYSREAPALEDLAAQARDHADERTQEYLDLAGENPAQQRSGNDGPQIFTAFVPPATLSDTAPAPDTTDQTLEQARQRAAQAHADLVRFETELETQRTRNNWNETHPDYQNGLHRAAQLRQEAARADHDLDTLQARTTNTTPPTTGHDLFAFPVFDIHLDNEGAASDVVSFDLQIPPPQPWQGAPDEPGGVGMDHGAVRFASDHEGVEWAYQHLTPLPASDRGAGTAGSNRQLTVRQELAVRNYTYGGDALVNQGLRGGSVSDPAHFRALLDGLDGAIAASPAPEPVVLHRGVNRDYLARLGVSDPDDPQSVQGLVGRTFSDGNYLSTSIGSTAAVEREVFMALRVPKGHPALNVMPFSSFGDEEREVLLPRGTRFVIHAAYERDVALWGDPAARSWFIEAEIVPADWEPDGTWTPSPLGDVDAGYRSDPGDVAPGTTYVNTEERIAPAQAWEGDRDESDGADTAESLRFTDPEDAFRWLSENMPITSVGAGSGSWDLRNLLLDDSAGRTPDLSSLQEVAIRDYLSENLSSVDEDLRRGMTNSRDSRFPASVERLDGAIGSRRTPQPLVVHHGTETDILYWLGADPDDPASVEALAGTVRSDAGYLLVDVGPDTPGYHSVYFTVRVPQGYPALNVTPLTGENQLLLKRDRTFVIHSVRRVPLESWMGDEEYQWLIDIEFVPDSRRFAEEGTGEEPAPDAAPSPPETVGSTDASPADTGPQSLTDLFRDVLLGGSGSTSAPAPNEEGHRAE